MPRGDGKARDKLLAAAIDEVRAKGYSATTVDELCQVAGVTKGAFFHHFKSKDDLAVAAAEYWSETTGQVFANAAYHRLDDPVDRVLGYVAFRKTLLRGRDVPAFTCLVGTMVQEAYATHPPVRGACAESILGHAAVLEADIAAALAATGVKVRGGARGLALHTQAVIQGAFILAKATGEARVAAASLDHLRRYLELLFRPDSMPSKN